MRRRRTDPGRRDRLVEVALDLIAEVGVAGVSLRGIAARADVPLGSLTYHFTGKDELLHDAFTRFADGIARLFEERLRAAEGPAEAEAAIVDLVHELSDLSGDRDRVLTYELYTLAARDPRYQVITTSWMSRSRQQLERHFDATTTRQLDALVEGLVLHRALDRAPFDRSLTADAVHRIASPAS